MPKAQTFLGHQVDNCPGRLIVQSPIQTYLDSLYREVREMRDGQLASYIPELARVDADAFGICLVTMDGVAYCAGDTDYRFTIQSISKAFVYAAALADRGKEYVSGKVGVEPSGDAFNSISLDPKTGAPFNPMINAGAIAITSIVDGETTSAQWRRIEGVMADFMGHDITVDEAVYRSEGLTGHRNRAIAWMLKNFDIIEGDPMASLDNYFRQCSILVDCRDLATMGATLAKGGRHPLSGKRALPDEHVKRVLSVMATCGMYDYAGSWLYEVGMPAKSGVGGGIVAVLPGRFGIGVFSPRLDAKGNSVRGIEVCKRLSRDFGLNIFVPTNDPSMALGRMYTGADVPSRRQPTFDMRDYLKERAHQVKYLSLNGFLAIDGIEFVIRKMLSMVQESHSFILDMHQVDAITESAARLLNRFRLTLAEDNIAVVLSRIHNRAAIAGPLRKVSDNSDRGFLAFEDNDLAVEWCENRLIEKFGRNQAQVGSLSDAELFKDLPAKLLRQVEAVGRGQSYTAGEQIIVIGQINDRRIFFIESGQVSILVPRRESGHQRLSTLGPGMMFGEMVLLGQSSRSATVTADSNVSCLVFEADDLERISASEPLLKITLLENLAKDMANKLRGATQWVAALA